MIYPADYNSLGVEGSSEFLANVEDFGVKVENAVGHDAKTSSIAPGSIVVQVAVPTQLALIDLQQRLANCSLSLCIEYTGLVICPSLPDSGRDCTTENTEATTAEVVGGGANMAIIGIVAGCCCALMIAAYVYKRHSGKLSESEQKVVPLESVGAHGSLRHKSKLEGGTISLATGLGRNRKGSQMSVRLSLASADMELLLGSDASEDFTTRISSTKKQKSDVSADIDAILDEEEPPAALDEPDFTDDTEVQLALKSALTAAALEIGINGENASLRLTPEVEAPVVEAFTNTLSEMELTPDQGSVATMAGMESLRGIAELVNRDLLRDALASGLVAAGFNDSLAFDQAEIAVDGIAGQRLRQVVTDAQLDSVPGLGAAISAALSASMKTMNRLAAERERQRLALQSRLTAARVQNKDATLSETEPEEDVVQAGIIRGVTELLQNSDVTSELSGHSRPPTGTIPSNAVSPAPPSAMEKTAAGVDAAMKAAGRDLQRTTLQFDNRRREQQHQLEQRRAEIAARKAQAKLAKAKLEQQSQGNAQVESPVFRRAAWASVASSVSEDTVMKSAGMHAQRNQLIQENNRRNQLHQLQMRMQKKQTDRLDRENSMEEAKYVAPSTLPGLIPRTSIDMGRPAVRSVPLTLPVLTTNGRPGMELRPPALDGRPKSPGTLLSDGLKDWASSI